MNDRLTDAFDKALLDFAAGQTGDTEGLNDEEQALLSSIQEWLPGLSDAIAVLVVTGEQTPKAAPVRHDDPIALMLGLVEDSAVRLDGRRLASLRKAAGYNIGDLAQRLQVRGWDISVKTVSAWERNLLNPPPATINAIAEELAVSSDAILTTTQAPSETLDGLFTDESIAAFFEEWASEANVSVATIAERSSRLLATAGKRNATSVTTQTLLAVLRHFRALPAFEVPE